MAADDINSVADQLAKTSVAPKHELSFAGKGFKLDKEEDAKEIVEAVEKCTTLTALRLEGNTLGIDAAKAIAKSLEKHPEFERALWSDMFTGRLKSEIPQALKHLGSAMMLASARLVELDLSDNAFGPNGMDGLVDLLTSPTCYSLKELRLNNNGLGVTGGRMLAKCLNTCYDKSSKAGTPLALKVFVSGRGRLENEGSIALSEPFKAMGSLEEVQMPQNGINHKGISALADAFSHNSNLRLLNMNDNTFTEKGARAMALALPKMQNLEVINFGDCLIRTDGAVYIADAIRSEHQKLREVNLGFCEIKVAGGQFLAEAMENKKNLEKLELDGNQFGEEGTELVQGIMEAMGKQDQLGSLEEDEGSEEEDEDDEDDEEEEEEEEEEDGEESKDPELQIKGISLTPRSDGKPISAADFLAFPSPTKLQNVQGDKPSAILQEAGGDRLSVDQALKTFMKVSSVVSDSDEKTKVLAFNCADALFSKVLANSDENVVSQFSNSLLVYLGLLKGEEKVPKPGSLKGPFIVLNHSVQQPYFPKSITGILQHFLSKSDPSLNEAKETRHQLLQTLFKF